VTETIDRIERADVYVVSAPIDPPAGVSVALSSAHEYVLIKLIDRSGRVGWGETYFLPGLEQATAHLAGLLIGSYPTSMRIHRTVLAATGASRYSQSAILIALDDLRARQLGVAIHTLYGGPTRSEVVAYAASQGYVEGEEVEHTWRGEAERAAISGYSAIKLRVGRNPIPREAAALEQVRDLLGEDVDLMVDGNGAYTAGQAIKVGRVLADLNVRWFEEPLPQGGYRGYPELRRRLDVPLAGGEILDTLDATVSAVDAGSFDIVQPDVVICGGIESALEAALVASLRGCLTVPHTSGGAIGIAATVQLLAVVDNPSRSPIAQSPLLECGQGPNPWRTDVLQGSIEPVQGKVTVPTGPGLGWDVDGALIHQRALRHITVQ